MFTGIIQTTGVVSSLEIKGPETRMRIAPIRPFQALSRGESIAVNGVCLTVEDFTREWFHVYASSQTMKVTNLGFLKQGQKVNLERALSMGDRLGGHLVSGHVDCLAAVISAEDDGESRIYHLSFPEEYSGQIIDKGSVALDGISLTVISCGPDNLKVNIIPATRKETTVSQWKMGAKVNMETDMIGKYVQKTLRSGAGQVKDRKPGSGITGDFLREHGFFPGGN